MNKPDDFDLVPRNRPAQSAGGTTPSESAYAGSVYQSSTYQSGGQPPAGQYPASQPPGSQPPAGGPPNWTPEPDDDRPSSGRSWGLIVTILGVALLAFGIGAALFTLRDRMSDVPTPTPGVVLTPTVDANSALATLVAAATLSATTPSITPSITITATGTITPTQTPTPETSPTPTLCALPVANGFQSSYNRDNFGCATTGAQVVWAAAEPFERGAMLWRSDTNTSYVFTQEGSWQTITSGWDGQSTASRGEPPPGRYVPERGFGWVWATSDPIFNALGWATDIEKGFCAEVQNFEEGFFLQSVPVDSCTPENLYNQATAGDWRPIYLAAHATGVWNGTLGGSTISAQPTFAAPDAPNAPDVPVAPVASVESRPESHGIFRANRNDNITIDGRLRDWPESGWIPIANVVQGAGNHDGPRDTVGVFQTAWNFQGLILAVRVQDDRFRAGPIGTDMWQGDSIEIQFDADLAGDFADTLANGDDSQIGVGFLEDARGMQMFRWLPLEIAGTLPVIAGGDVNERGGDRGYELEVLLPWSYLGIAAPEAGRAYGFNVSINDNDDREPQQQTVVSASPARTTYNDPTQWGTLLLLP